MSDFLSPDKLPRLGDGVSAAREALAGRRAQVVRSPLTYPRGACFFIIAGTCLFEANWRPKRKKGVWRLALLSGLIACQRSLDPDVTQTAGDALETAHSDGTTTYSSRMIWVRKQTLEPCAAPPFEFYGVEVRDFTPGAMSLRGMRLSTQRTCGYCTELHDLISLVLGELRSVGL